MKTKLTNTVIAGLKPGPTRRTIYDTTISGFGVRIMPSGKMSYFLAVRIGKSPAPANLLIGSTDQLGIEKAKAV